MSSESVYLERKDAVTRRDLVMRVARRDCFARCLAQDRVEVLADLSDVPEQVKIDVQLFDY